MVHEDQLRCPLCGQPYTPDTADWAADDPRTFDRWALTSSGARDASEAHAGPDAAATDAAEGGA